MKDLEDLITLYNKKDINQCIEIVNKINLTRYNIYDADAIKLVGIINKMNKSSDEDKFELLSKLVNILKQIIMEKKAFIVHGWDNELKLETKNYFQNVLNVDCTILHEKDGGGDVIINKFEKYANESTFAITLLSNLDNVDESFSNPNAPKRPRPNVLFEMGYFFAKYGRERVIILKKGDVEINSDIYGIEYIDVSDGIESAGEKIRKRIISIFNNC